MRLRMLKAKSKIKASEPGGEMMKNTVLKMQIESMEQQLKLLKTKVVKPIAHKKLSDLHGIFKGKLDLTLEEIKEHEYSIKGNL